MDSAYFPIRSRIDRGPIRESVSSISVTISTVSCIRLPLTGFRRMGAGEVRALRGKQDRLCSLQLGSAAAKVTKPFGRDIASARRCQTRAALRWTGSFSMRRISLVCLLLVALLLAYWAWPFFALRTLAVNVQTRNVAAVSEQVDFTALRHSLTEQIITAYLRITGKDKKLGLLAGMATAIGTSIADPIVSEFVNPEALAKLLRGETVPSDVGQVSFKVGQLPASFDSAMRAWLSTDYGIGKFAVWLPVKAAAADQFRLQMRLERWRWQVTGIDLPENLRNRIAQQLAKKFP